MSKKRRKGRSIDHTWQCVKYKGDIGYYAKCSCGFHYGCNRGKGIALEFAPEKLWNYCPKCGARKKWYCEDVKYIDKYFFED